MSTINKSTFKHFKHFKHLSILSMLNFKSSIFAWETSTYLRVLVRKYVLVCMFSNQRLILWSCCLLLHYGVTFTFNNKVEKLYRVCTIVVVKMTPIGTRTRNCFSRVRRSAGLSVPGRDTYYMSCSVFIFPWRSLYSALNVIPLHNKFRILYRNKSTIYHTSTVV